LQSGKIDYIEKSIESFSLLTIGREISREMASEAPPEKRSDETANEDESH
jgi:hypothetical protein